MRLPCRTFHRFDLVMAASRWMVDEMRELGLDNVVHQPLGVDLEHFNPSRRSAQWRRELGLADDAIVLAYVGRFAPEKNLGLLVEMVDTLGEPYVLVAQGAGPCPPRGRRVRVLPYSADPRSVAVTLASADVFVHAGTPRPSDWPRSRRWPAARRSCCRQAQVSRPDRRPRRHRRRRRDRGAARRGRPGALRSIAATLREYALKAAGPFDQRRTFARQFERYAALTRRRPQPARIGGLHRA